LRFVGIDPSTKTGFVALDLQGNILRAKELTGIGKKDPMRMRTLIHEVKDHVQKGDLVCIEGFGYASQQAIQLGGIGWGIRMMLEARGITYYEPAPQQVKKFVGVSNWTGEEGSKRRLQGKEKKDAVKASVREMYTFCHPSDNVNDAFVLAQIARHIYLAQQSQLPDLSDHQLEVVRAILNPPEKKKRKKVAK
jgi:crossover junction endodeoxyribonuclease RuvC